MRASSWLGIALAAALGTTGAISQSSDQISQAVQLQDGTVYFNSPPTLENAATTERLTTIRGATYYFTLNLPENAGEPLQRVTIAQQDSSNAVRRVEYETEDTRAFIGTNRRGENPLTLGETTYDRDTQTVSVTFDPPVPPGTVVTIGLRPERNPRQEGIYEFGVTAYPAGDKSYGQFLGYGRLSFDSPDGPFPFL